VGGAGDLSDPERADLGIRGGIQFPTQGGDLVVLGAESWQRSCLVLSDGDSAGLDVAEVRPVRDEIERRVLLLDELGVPASEMR